MATDGWIAIDRAHVDERMLCAVGTVTFLAQTAARHGPRWLSPVPPANLPPLPTSNIASYPRYDLARSLPWAAKVTLSVLFGNAIVAPALFL